MADVSVIIPVHNGEQWLDECLQSVAEQDFSGSLEVSIFNDASTDGSWEMLCSWKKKLQCLGIEVILGGHSDKTPKGVGYAKNMAVKQSTGCFLCFLDADDIMLPGRLAYQLSAVQSLPPSTLIGCQVRRTPEGSTERYTNWANGLSPEQLYTQVYTSHGPTLLMPTWFCSRQVFDRLGGFDETGKGTPEDLIFFYEHIRHGGLLHRVDECLVIYRFHPQATTLSVKEETIWELRMRAIQEQVLSKWSRFTIWNAGKQGRHFYRSLSLENQKKVEAFCDVDPKKLDKGFYTYEESKERPKPKIPIIHFSQAVKPFIICVKLDLTGGNFEKNLSSLNIKEGTDFFHFN